MKVSKMQLVTFTLSGGTEIKFYTNMGTEFIQPCIENWLPRANKYNAMSIVEYINSKTHISGHQALTETQYNAMDI